jgi:hypothetical protein
MLKENAALPGIEALKSLSLGLEVSLDWLVFGGDQSGADMARTARVSSRAAVLPILKHILEDYRAKDITQYETGTLLGLRPEELAAEIAADAGDRARGITAIGASRSDIKTGERALHRRDKT